MKPKVPLLPVIIRYFQTFRTICLQCVVTKYPQMPYPSMISPPMAYPTVTYLPVSYLSMHYPHVQGTQGNHYYAFGYHYGQEYFYILLS